MAFGAIDLFSGSKSITGTNLWQVDKNPLNQIDEGVEDIVGKQATQVGDFMMSSILNSLDAMLGIQPSPPSSPPTSTTQWTDIVQWVNDFLGFFGLKSVGGTTGGSSSSTPGSIDWNSADSLITYIESLLIPTNLLTSMALNNIQLRSGINLCIDPSFEQGLVWSGTYGTISTDVAHTGAHSMKIDGNGTDLAGHMLRNSSGPLTLYVQSGEVFDVGVWVYPKVGNSGGGTVGLQMVCTDSTDNDPATTVAITSVPVPTAGQWTLIQGTGTVPSTYDYDTADFEFTISSGVLSTDVIYVDDEFVYDATQQEKLAAAITGLTNPAITDLETWSASLYSMLGLPELTSPTFDALEAVRSWIDSLVYPSNMLAPLVSDASTTGTASGFVPMENLAIDLIGEAIGDVQGVIDAILETVGFSAGSGTVTDVNQYFTDFLSMFSNPELTNSAFNAATATENYINNLIHPTNLLAPMNPITQLINALNIPGLDASKITTGSFAQTMISGLTNAWTALFGSTSAPATSSTVLQTSVQYLTQAWQALFGATSAPASTAQVLQIAIKDLNLAWTALFGSSTEPATSSTVLQTSVQYLTNAWQALFGSTSAPATSAQVLQTTIKDLNLAWTALFGSSTEPATSSAVLQTSVQYLTQAWQALFGATSAPASTAQVLQTTIKDLNKAWTALFGASTNPATSSQVLQTSIQYLTNAWTALFGGTTAPATSSTVLNTSVQSSLGLANLWTDLTTHQANFTTMWQALFGSSSAPATSAQILQTTIKDLNLAWQALFGNSTSDPASTAQVLQTSVQYLTNAWQALFGGTTAPATSSLVLQTAIQDLNKAWTALFGSSTNPATSATVLQTSVQYLTNAWTALFGGTTAPATSSTVLNTSVQSSLGLTNLFSDITTHQTNMANAWTALFGSSTAPATSASVLQTSVANLTRAWTALFGSTTAPASTAQVLQTSVQLLTNAWTALFGGTTAPATSSAVLNTSVQSSLGFANLLADLTNHNTSITNLNTATTNAWSALFGSSTTPATSATILQTTVQNLTHAWQALFGYTTAPATSATVLQTSVQNLVNAWTALFGGTTAPATSSTVLNTSVQSSLGFANLLADLTAHNTSITNLNTATTNAWAALFGATTTPATSATILQTTVQNLTNAWQALFGYTTNPATSATVLQTSVALLTNAWNALFGSTSAPATSSQVLTGSVKSALANANIGADILAHNTSITGLNTATQNAWQALFGASTTPATSATILQTTVQYLTNAWTALFGSTSAPATSSAVLNTSVQSSLGLSNLLADITQHQTNIVNAWTALFGSSTTPATSATVLQTSVANLTKAWQALFGYTTAPASSATVLQTSVANLVNAWTALFGSTSAPATSAAVLNTSVQSSLGFANLLADLTNHNTSITNLNTATNNAWQALFGASTTPATSATILQTTVQNLTNAWQALFGYTTNPATSATVLQTSVQLLTNAWNALFGSTSAPATSSQVLTASVKSALANANIGLDILAHNTSITGLNTSTTNAWQALFGSSTTPATSATILQTTVQNLTNAWSALFGFTTNPATSSTVLTSSVQSSLGLTNLFSDITTHQTNMANAWTALFGASTAPATSAQVLQTTVQNLTRAWTALFGSTTAPASTAQVLQTSVQQLVNAWQALFGATTAPATSQLVQNTSVASSLGLTNLYTDIQQHQSNFLNTWSNLFGLPAVSSVIQPSAVPGLDASKIVSGVFPSTMLQLTEIAASAITGLLSPLNIPGLDAGKITSGTFSNAMVPGIGVTWSTIIGALSGSGQDIAAVEAALNAIPSPNILSSLGLTNLNADLLFHNTSMANAWQALFGATTAPATSATVLQTSVANLTKAWQALFGYTTAPASSATVLQTSVQNLVNAWTALFGGTTAPATSSTVLTSSVQSSLGLTNLFSDITTHQTNMSNAWTALFGSSTAPATSAQVLQTTVQNLTRAWTALFGSTTAPASTAQVLQTSVQQLVNAWQALFGSTTAPATSQLVQNTSVASSLGLSNLLADITQHQTNMANAWTALFGASTAPATSATVLQTSVQLLTNAWNALFGATSAPATSSQVLVASVKSALANANIGVDITTHNTSITGLNTATTNAWQALFGSSTTPATSATILQTTVQNLTNAWQALFGYTTNPATSATVLQTSVQLLTNAWNALFGSTSAPATSSQVLVASVKSALANANIGLDITSHNTSITNLNTATNNAWQALFGSSTTPATSATILQTTVQNLVNAWQALFGYTTNPATSSSVLSTSVQSSLSLANLNADLLSHNTSITGLNTATANAWAALFGASTTPATSATVLQTSVTNLVNAWMALFGATTAPATTQQVLTGSVKSALANANIGVDITTHNTSITNLNTATNNAWQALFGSSTTPATSATILQTTVQNLTNAWVALFGSSTNPATSATVLQTSVANLVNAWTALFGSTSAPATSATVLQTSVQLLTNAWTALFGSTSAPATSSQVNTGSVKSALANANIGVDIINANTSVTGLNTSTANAWQALFGSSTNPATSATVLQTSVQLLTNAWSALFGSTSAPATSAQVLQSSVQQLSNAWRALFGSTTNPATTSVVQNTSVQSSLGLANLLADLTAHQSNFTTMWQALFGSSTAAPASTATVLQTSVSQLTNAWQALFGATSAPATSATVLQTSVQNLVNAWTALFGGTTAPATSSQVLQTSVQLLTNAWAALFGGTTAPGTSSQVLVASVKSALANANIGLDITSHNTSITNLNTATNNAWQALFGSSTTPATTATILQTTVQNLTNAWQALFGYTTAPATSATVLQTSVANLVNAWNALFGSTTAPATSSQVLTTSVLSALANANIGQDITAHNTSITNLNTNTANAWSALFGSTTAPATSAKVQQTSVSNLTNVWTALFGSTTAPATSATVLTTSVKSGLGLANLNADVNSLLPLGLWQTSEASGTNLVISPQFDDSTIYRETTGGTGAVFGYTTAQAHSGTQSYSIQTSTLTSGQSDLFYLSSNTQGGGAAKTLAAALKVQPGQWFYGEFWVLAGAANTATVGIVRIMFALHDSTGVNPNQNFVVATTNMNGMSSSTWTKISGWYQIPTGYDLCWPFMQCANQNVASQTFYFDDVRIVENTQAQAVTQQLYGGSSITQVLTTAIASALANANIGADITQHNTSITSLNTATNNAWQALFGSSTTPATSATILQTTVQNLTNAWQALFGYTTSPATSATVLQTSVANLVNAWTALFGSTSAPATSSTVLQTSVQLLTNAWTALFGSTSAPATSSQVNTGSVKSALANANIGVDITSHNTSITSLNTNTANAWTALFGSSTTPATSATILQTTVSGLTNVWTALFGSTTAPATSATVLQTSVQLLTNAWTALFGSTSAPATSSQVNTGSVKSALANANIGLDITSHNTSITNLNTTTANAWTALFGNSTSPATSATVLQTAVSGLTNAWRALFGSTSAPATSATVLTTAVQSGLGLANLNADVNSLLPLSLWQTASSDATNLVISPQFEDSTIARTTSGPGTFGYSTAASRSGVQSYAVTTSSGTSDSDTFYLSATTVGGENSSTAASAIKVQAGQWFYGEIYVLGAAANTATAGTCRIGVHLHDSTGTNPNITGTIGSVNISGLSSTTWTKISGWYQIPTEVTAGYDLMWPFGWVSNPNVGTQTFYFDDARIIENTQAQAVTQQLYGGSSITQVLTTAIASALANANIGQDITAHNTSITGLNTATNNAWQALFGASTTPATSATVLQTAVQNLTNAWQALFGGTTAPATSSQVLTSSVLSALSNANIGQDITAHNTSITGLNTATANAWQALFGASTNPATSATVLQSSVALLTNAWTALFGSTSAPATSSQVNATSVKSALANANIGVDITNANTSVTGLNTSTANAWQALFGASTAPATSATVLQTSVANLVNAWTALFGSTTAPATSAKVQQTSVSNLTNAWTALFGSTTAPATSSSVLTTSVQSSLGLTNLFTDIQQHQANFTNTWTTLFGFPGLATVIQPAAVPGIDASKIISGVLPASTVANLPASAITSGQFNSQQIPGIDASKIISGTIPNAFLPGVVNTWSTITNALGGLGTDIASMANALAPIVYSWTALFGSSTAPSTTSTVLQTSVALLTNAWNALFGSTTAPATSSQVLTTAVKSALANANMGQDITAHNTSITGLNTATANAWAALFGSSTTPATSATVLQTSVANLVNAWTALFGSTSAPATSATVLQTSVANLTNAWTALFGGTTAPASTQTVTATLSGNQIKGGQFSAGQMPASLLNTTIPVGNVLPLPATAVTAVAFDAAGTWAAGGVNGSMVTSLNLNGTHTLGATANYLVVVVTFVTLSSLGYTCTVQLASGQSLTQVGRIGVPGTLYAWQEFYVLQNPPTGAQTINVALATTSGGGGYCDVLAAESASYSGVSTDSPPTFVTSTGSTSLSQTVGSGTNANQRLVQSFLHYYNSTGDSLTAYTGGTSRGNPGVCNSGAGHSIGMVLGDAAGASAGVTFGATAGFAGAGYTGGALILNPTGPTVGTGFEAYNTSTSSLAYSATNPAVMPNNSYPTAAASNSADYSGQYNATTGVLTIPTSGWYKVKISFLTQTYTGYLLGPVLYKNGLVYEAGITPYLNSNGQVVSDTFIVYCNGGPPGTGDTLQPGYFGTYGLAQSSAWQGESTGTKMYWSVSLMNRSNL